MTDHTAKRTRENLLKAGLMTALELDERPVRVDFCLTRTDQWRLTPRARRRTGFGQGQPIRDSHSNGGCQKTTRHSTSFVRRRGRRVQNLGRICMKPPECLCVTSFLI